MKAKDKPFLSFYETRELVGWPKVSRITMHRYVAAGAFPEPVKLTDGPKPRLVWARKDLEAWLHRNVL